MTKVIRLFYGLFFIDTRRAEQCYKLEYSHVIHCRVEEVVGEEMEGEDVTVYD